jgi:hypothetical protein
VAGAAGLDLRGNGSLTRPAGAAQPPKVEIVTPAVPRPAPRLRAQAAGAAPATGSRVAVGVVVLLAALTALIAVRIRRARR